MANMLIFIRYLVLSKGECHQYAYIYKVFGALPTDLPPSPRGVNLKKKGKKKNEKSQIFHFFIFSFFRKSEKMKKLKIFFFIIFSFVHFF